MTEVVYDPDDSSIAVTLDDAAMAQWLEAMRREQKMRERTLTIGEIRVPRFLYGTAWKGDATPRLVERAIRQGFRGIDTANQARHYNETVVGQAVAAAIESGLVARGNLFLQTKFTFRRGQDHRLPYDPEAPIAVHVEQSFASSLNHLRTEFVDSYLLHGPTYVVGLAADQWEAWRAMEAIHDSRRAKMLGVSNFPASNLNCSAERRECVPPLSRTDVTPTWVGGVASVSFCAANDLVCQGFSLLTANQEVMSRPELARIAARHHRTVADRAKSNPHQDLRRSVTFSPFRFRRALPPGFEAESHFPPRGPRRQPSNNTLFFSQYSTFAGHVYRFRFHFSGCKCGLEWSQHGGKASHYGRFNTTLTAKISLSHRFSLTRVGLKL